MKRLINSFYAFVLRLAQCKLLDRYAFVLRQAQYELLDRYAFAKAYPTTLTIIYK
ncbi:hypothetical protein [uncultured Dokdonia sp.]|uniref:hypothetical protein n=1 Tax=uncultured Dokdonia sp. TaxID=575653 RepID=UPI00261170EB|nr:hypothetical protein [uncultured Dokdonia sp.]